MYISLNWIKDFVDLSGIDEEYVINKFTMSCAEVEGFERKGADISGVKVGKILSVENHPNSTKLHLLKVDVGDKVLDIVCGAPNVRVGLIVPVAVEGANVGGVTIKPTKVAGYESFGMCCSSAELKISDDNSGLMELDDTFRIGADIKEYLDIDDVVFEVDNTSLTNRPDLWGHYGLAREFAAITGRKLKELDVEDLSKYDKLPGVDISIESSKCLRYCGMKISNVTETKSPYNMQIRLYYTGMRAINLLADLTNYIMLELAQPMHAFDGAKVNKIIVKDLAKDTKFKTLDGEERVLAKGTMTIDNGSGPVAVAGVMGGLDSEIENYTGDLLLESTNFDATTIRRCAKSLGLRTEASNRYEKKLDPNTCDLAIARYLYLLKQSDKNIKVISKCTDVYVTKYSHIDIDITKDYIDRYIGISIPMDRVVHTLESLQFGVKVKGETISVSVPSFRATKDITCTADIVEEITRIYGYDNIPAKCNKWDLTPVIQERNVNLDYNLKYALADRYNLNEVYTRIWDDMNMLRSFGIEPKGYVKVINSINGENNYIRETMCETLLCVAKQNEKNYDNLGIFELGHVVVGKDKSGLAKEEKHLGILLAGKESVEEKLLKAKDIVNYLFEYIMKADVRLVAATPTREFVHPVNYYNIVSEDKVLGEIGSLHPRVEKNFSKYTPVFVEINLGNCYSLPVTQETMMKGGKYPTTTLDFTFVLGQDRYYSEIENVAQSLKSNLKYKYTLANTYDDGSGNISYTLRFLVTSNDHTLNSSEIENFHKYVIDSFASSNISLKS